MKLDFKKAYDTVCVLFLFKVMKAFGIPNTFSEIVKMLFHGAEAIVCISRGESSHFPILCRIHQGCLLAPYLFLFIGEVLNITIKKAMLEGSLSRIILSKNANELSIIQYTNDSNLMIATTKSNFTTATQLIYKFGLASRLCIN